MKKLVVIILLAAFSVDVEAQTWSEWFRQKKTQKKYLLAQIAALKVYAGYLSKGYKIADKGIRIVQDIKRGDFNLHANYFASLSDVNSSIKNYKKVSAIISIQEDIVRQTSATLLKASNNAFGADEKIYFKKVIDNLLSNCLQNLDELTKIISNGNYEMKDDERIKAIDHIYMDMLDNKAFAGSFCGSISRLALQRNSDRIDIIISRKLNALP